MFSCKHSLHRFCIIRMMQKYERSNAFEKRSSEKMRELVRRVIDLYEQIEEQKKTLQRSWTRKAEQENNLLSKTNQMTTELMKKITPDFGIGGFFKDDTREE